MANAVLTRASAPPSFAGFDRIRHRALQWRAGGRGVHDRSLDLDSACAAAVSADARSIKEPWAGGRCRHVPVWVSILRFDERLVNHKEDHGHLTDAFGRSDCTKH